MKLKKLEKKLLTELFLRKTTNIHSHFHVAEFPKSESMQIPLQDIKMSRILLPIK